MVVVDRCFLNNRIAKVNSLFDLSVHYIGIVRLGKCLVHKALLIREATVLLRNGHTDSPGQS
jgi:hypothetical protein